MGSTNRVGGQKVNLELAEGVKVGGVLVHRQFGNNREMIRWRAVGGKRDGSSEELEEVMTKSSMCGFHCR